jgi:tRNA-intron endonuclease
LTMQPVEGGSRQPARATLSGKKVIIADEAEGSQVHVKGYYGKPLSGGGLELDLMEATYLAESGRVAISAAGKAVAMSELVSLATREMPGFEIKYLVYRDIRQRGYVIKPGTPPLDFRVLPRGGAPGKAHSKYWIAAISERGIFDAEALMGLMESTNRVHKIFLLAVVDEEGDLTYYRVKDILPKGRLKFAVPKGPAEGLVMEDRVLVLEPGDASALYSSGFYGKMMGSGLHLSLLEAGYLSETGLLNLKEAHSGKKLSWKKFRDASSLAQPDFDLRMRVYKDLKGAGMLVKTGFKYGSHFRVYEGDPDNTHARYLVHAIPADYRSMWAEISRAVRLAHGVRKEILLGRVGESNIEYLRLERIRP